MFKHIITIHFTPKKNDHQVVYGALEFLAEFQEGGCAASVPSTNNQTSWMPPLPTRYKINVDGAVFAAQKLVGIGVIVRDSDGSLIGACSKKLRFPLGAVEVEAKAVEFGLQFAKDSLIQDFILEGDSLVVFTALLETSSPPSLIAVVIYGSLFASHEFCLVTFSHVHQQGNYPAHLLAKHALGIDDYSVWTKEIPCFLEQAFLMDVM